MALNYTTFFTVIGKYVKGLNTLFGKLTEITTGLNDIETILEANSLNRLTVELHPVFEQMKRDVEGWPIDIINELRSVVMTDRAFVRDGLVLQNTDFDSIMQEIINDMISQIEIVKGPLLTGYPIIPPWPAFTAKPTVSLLGSPYLEGIASPHPGFPSSRYYLDIAGQFNRQNYFGTTSDMYLEVVSAPSDGEETLRWISINTQTNFYKDQTASPGIGPEFPLAQTENEITKIASELNTFTGGKPEGWKVSSATDAVANVDYGEYFVSFRGSSSLVVKGDEGGGPHSVTLTQNVPNLIPGKLYGFAVKVSDNLLSIDHTVSKGSGNQDLVTLTIFGNRKSGTVWIESKIKGVDSDNYAARDWFTLFDAIEIPFDINTETLKASIKFDPFSTDWMLIDEIVIAPLRYFNGLAYMVMRGKMSERLEVGDRSPSDTWTNDEAGVFQSFFKKAFGYQLFSEDLGETINDDLAVL